MKNEIAVTGWYMEFRDDTRNSYKFYEVLVTDNNVTVLRWGRIGAAGQSGVSTYSTLDQARDAGLKQVYAKRAKGYASKTEDYKFIATTAQVDAARQGLPAGLAAAFHKAVDQGLYAGAKDSVLKHYEDFAEQAKRLMTDAANDELGEVVERFDQLEQVWAEIENQHAEVTVAMQMAKLEMTKRLFAGSS